MGRGTGEFLQKWLKIDQNRSKSSFLAFLASWTCLGFGWLLVVFRHILAHLAVAVSEWEFLAFLAFLSIFCEILVDFAVEVLVEFLSSFGRLVGPWSILAFGCLSGSVGGIFAIFAPRPD